ncbi:MAG: hypothetical protein A2355_07635, partial [Spirochaetes bacterium RIFOXYB1_FULL_32_8]
DKTTLLALYSTFEALDHAGVKYSLVDKKRGSYSIDNVDPFKVGVVIGTGIGGVESLISSYSFQILNNAKKKLNDIKNDNPGIADDVQNVDDLLIKAKRFSPFAVSMIMGNASAANIGIRFGLNGMNKTVSAACASGTAAIGYAYEAVKSGKLDMAVSGGVEYLYDEYGGLYFGFDSLKALCRAGDIIEEANRPFDKARTGFLYSQGGSGILILEDYDSAIKRGATIHAEIKSFAETNDAHNIMMIEKSGKCIERVIVDVMKQAGIQPKEVDYINTHGTATELNDEVESAAIEKIFGDKVLINSTKSLIGHSFGASGALEAVISVMSITKKKVHLNRNIKDPVRDLNFVRESTDAHIKTVLSESFGFGGHNTAIIFTEVQS